MSNEISDFCVKLPLVIDSPIWKNDEWNDEFNYRDAEIEDDDV